MHSIVWIPCLNTLDGHEGMKPRLYMYYLNTVLDRIVRICVSVTPQPSPYHVLPFFFLFLILLLLSLA
jgi:hypothetical protein